MKSAREIKEWNKHFKYSKRKGTRAAVMQDQVAEQIKTGRSAELISLGNEMSDEFRMYYTGKIKDVLFEEKVEINGKSYYTGYTKEYVKVAKESEETLENQIIEGKITGRLTDDIYIMR